MAPPRRSTRRTKTTTTTQQDEGTEKIDVHMDTVETEGKVTTKAKRTTTKRKTSTVSSSDESNNKKTKKKVPTKSTTTTKETDSASVTAKPKATKKKASDHQRITDRDVIPKLWDEQKAKEEFGSYTFKIGSWNVAGLRALMKNHPTALSDLATKYTLDVLCLQETKLQEMHLDDPKLKINGHLLHEEGYDSYYNCATSKKGYSGTAVFVKKRSSNDSNATTKNKTKKQSTIGNFFTSPKDNNDKKSGSNTTSAAATTDNSDIAIDVKNLIPLNVSYKLGMEKHDTEGRIIGVDFPLFSMANLYVPNSGQKLDRLSYRTDEWDKDLLQYMKDKSKTRPVVWLGDLNVAHTYKDVWNDGAKHLAKSAGTTAEERASFQEQLNDGFVDAFRHLHPEAMGQYTYWSQRAGNREPNKGLRLDYFICSNNMIHNGEANKKEECNENNNKVFIRDSYIVHEQVGSDHCPIILELEIKK